MKRKMKKRVLAAVMALSLLLISGCGKDAKITNVTLDENGNFVPTQQLDITVWTTQGTDYVAKEIENNIVEDWLVDKTKVKIENIYGNDGGQWDAKLTKLVAGDNLPHLVHCGSGQGATHFAKLDEMGKVWELTPEMLQKYAPEVWRRTPSYFWERNKVDGKILSIPYTLPLSRETLPDLTDEEYNLLMNTKVVPESDVMTMKTGYLCIRDDILKMFYPEAKSYDELVALLEETGKPIDEAMLDIPIKTTQEFVDFMYKIRDAKITEGGKKVYAFGYSGGDNWEALAWLGGDMCGYKTHSYSGTWNTKTKSMELPLVKDVIKEAAKLQNQMINDGVIDPESLAHTSNQFETKILNGRYAIFSDAMLGGLSSANALLERSGKKYRFRPFVTQVVAQEGYEAIKKEALQSDSVGFLKTLSEAELIQMLNWVNVQYTEEYEDIKNWGPKEKGLYQETEDGKREFTDERFTTYYVYKDQSVMTPEETLGLQGPSGYKIGGLFGVQPTTFSKYTPDIMLGVENYVPDTNSGFKFFPDNKHVTNVKTVPVKDIWDSQFGNIEEVNTFWNARGQWENKIKLALAAPKDEFDSSWNDMVEFVHEIVDVKTMEKKMNEIAQPLMKKIEESSK